MTGQSGVTPEGVLASLRAYIGDAPDIGIVPGTVGVELEKLAIVREVLDLIADGKTDAALGRIQVASIPLTR